MQPVKAAVVQKPAETVTLRAAEGEAMIARLSVYAPSRTDCASLVQVGRWYFWLVWTVQEAQLSLQQLRTVLCGRRPQPPPPSAPEVSLPSAPAPSHGGATGASSSGDAERGPAAEAGPLAGTVALAIASPPRPTGGHRPGTGRLGAEAYGGGHARRGPP